MEWRKTRWVRDIFQLNKDEAKDHRSEYLDHLSHFVFLLLLTDPELCKTYTMLSLSEKEKGSSVNKKEVVVNEGLWKSFKVVWKT